MRSSEDLALETIEEIRLAAKVREAMGTCHCRRRLIALTAFERYSPAQAAAALALPKAARTRLHRARVRIAAGSETLSRHERDKGDEPMSTMEMDPFHGSIA